MRDDGLSYGDYLEQLTFLLFLKMADEQSRPPFNKKSPIPGKYSWPELLKGDGDELEISRFQLELHRFVRLAWGCSLTSQGNVTTSPEDKLRGGRPGACFENRRR